MLNSLAFLLVFLSAGFSQKLTIRGKIDTKDTLKIFVFYAGNKSDSLITVDGSFNFRLSLAEPSLVRLGVMKKDNMRENASRLFFVQTGEVVINATSIRNLYDAALSISNPNYNNLYKNYRARLDPLIRINRMIIDRSFDTGRTEPEKKMFREIFEKVNTVQTEVMEQFALENTGNIVGAYVFSEMHAEKDAYKLDSIYHLFDKSFQKTSYLKQMEEKIRNMKTLENGKPAPHFASVTAEGTPFKLSDLKGKFIVLDFWGSWCQPCIAGIPKMKEYYEKYKNKLEYVSIACNDTDAAWRAAIKKYDLTWVQLFNNKEKLDISLLYNVMAFPTKVIIGKDGEFIASFKSENEDFYQAIDKLLQ